MGKKDRRPVLQGALDVLGSVHFPQLSGILISKNLQLVVYQLTIDGYSRLRLIQKSWSYR